MSTVEIAIRSIQHYMYCPHRWGLMEIGKVWAENAFVTKANLLHNRVHDPDCHYVSQGKKVYTSIPVYHDGESYNLYGVVDCMEVTLDDRGVSINDSAEKYSICIVEYKPTKPRDNDYHPEDLMQVFAQKVCMDYVFGCDCDAALYYADIKRRVRLSLRDNFEIYDAQLKNLLQEMRTNLEHGFIPPVRKGQKCSGCSMRDLCMPSMKQPKDLMTEIRKIQEAST